MTGGTQQGWGLVGETGCRGEIGCTGSIGIRISGETGWINADKIGQTIEKIEQHGKVKCQCCRQWGDRQSVCNFCGSPVE